MATHIDTNTWKIGLENKLLKTFINSSPNMFKYASEQIVLMGHVSRHGQVAV